MCHGEDKQTHEIRKACRQVSADAPSHTSGHMTECKDTRILADVIIETEHGIGETLQIYQLLHC